MRRCRLLGHAERLGAHLDPRQGCCRRGQVAGNAGGRVATGQRSSSHLDARSVGLQPGLLGQHRRQGHRALRGAHGVVVVLACRRQLCLRDLVHGACPGEGQEGTLGHGLHVRSGVRRAQVAGPVRFGVIVRTCRGARDHRLEARNHRRGFLDAGDQAVDVGVGPLQGACRRPTSLDEPRLDVREPVRPEEPLQQCSALVRGRAQERGEVPLGQQHDLGELLHPHPQDVGQQLCRLVVAAAAWDPAAVDLLAQQGAGLFGRRPLPTLLRTVPGGGAGHLEAPARRGELAAHLRRQASLGMVAAQPAAGTRTRDPAVEGEAERVQHAGLAGPGRAVQQEQPLRGQGVDVDLLGTREGAERLDPQPVQPHAAPSSRASSAAGRCWSTAVSCRRPPSSASRSSSRSASMAGAPRTWSTKAQQRSTSPRPSTRSA